MLGSQASGAQVEPFWLAIYNDSSRVNIGHPAAFSVALGMADVMAEPGYFST